MQQKHRPCCIFLSTFKYNKKLTSKGLNFETNINGSEKKASNFGFLQNDNYRTMVSFGCDEQL